ncbi:MAG: hypothetical protein ABIO39_02600 [Caulobacteraceae bacterium]
MASRQKHDIEGGKSLEWILNERVLVSERASDAIERFAKLAERAELERRGDRRVDAANHYAAARRAVEPRERAILDLTALKRRTLAELAAQTGQTAESLAQLLSNAGERLADYFESRA